jgi:DNA-directed RNA polymerase subunit M/transcription elongation factor TFIIS
MDCPTCGKLMIRTRATTHGEEYNYCRKCKKELDEMAHVTRILGGKNIGKSIFRKTPGCWTLFNARTGKDVEDKEFSSENDAYKWKANSNFADDDEFT